MPYEIKEKHWQNGSFTVQFSFSNGVAHFDGFAMETVVSHGLHLKYRVLVKHPVDGKFWTMKGMENPMSQDEISSVLKKQHKGYLAGTEFVFEVFDETGETRLFNSRFNAKDKISPEGYGSEHLVVTSFSWNYEFPTETLKQLAKQALEEHVQ